MQDVQSIEILLRFTFLNKKFIFIFVVYGLSTEDISLCVERKKAPFSYSVASAVKSVALKFGT